MRILHTADWHLGKPLEGRSRAEEERAFIDELCRLVDQEQVQVILLAGDVFDTANPSADALALFCQALARLSAGGQRAVVVIAGNHDQPKRLTALRDLACQHGVVLFGLPSDEPLASTAPGGVRCVAQGPGWVELTLPGAEHAVVIVALAYPSESRFGAALAPVLTEEAIQQGYSQRVGQWFAEAALQYRPDTVRLAMSHLFVRHGTESGPQVERSIQLGGAYTVDAEVFPADAQYVALGHLHRQQPVSGSSPVAYYAGSPLAHQFHEDQNKQVIVLDLEPTTVRAEPRFVPLRSGRRLVRHTLEGEVGDAHRWLAGEDRTHQWIDLTLQCPSSPSVHEIHTLRAAFPQVIHLNVVLPVLSPAAPQHLPSELAEAEKFSQYYLRHHQRLPDPDVLTLFLDLLGVEEAQDSPVEVAR